MARSARSEGEALSSGPLGVRVDVLALVFMVAALLMFVFAASGRELRRFNEIALGLVFLTAALICQFTAITNTTVGR